MKRLFTLLVLLFAFSIMNAQETYRFRTDVPQGFNIGSSTSTGLSLHYALNEIIVADIEYDEAQGKEIVMKGCFGSFAEGLPNLPYENRYIAVPRGAKVSVSVKEKASQTIQNINLLPAAPLQMNGEDKRPALRWDMDVFGKDANFPSENVAIAQTTQIRGLDVAMINVTPFRYNPIRKTLEVIYDMDIEVRFEGGEGQFGDARYRNPAWDGILHDLVLNSDMLPEAHYYERLDEALRDGEEGCEYLIITIDDPDFLAWADTLKRFRTRQGILTKVISTTDCGGNEPDDIRNYIQNAYENWAIPPAAVLLFAGNHATEANFGIKPYFLTSPISWNQSYTYATDSPMVDMNGDSIPDLALSRMTVLNAERCQQQVTKLLEYEITPPTDAHYYDHPVINSGYQDTKWFAITAQVTNNFFRDRLGKHPGNIYMKYYLEDYDPIPPDSIWSVDPNTGAVLDYFGPNGAQYLPSSIGYLDDWIDMHDKLPFQHAVNEGSFITFYRDHSNPDWWCCSDIHSSDIISFQNRRPTFFFSIGCSTNNFWNNWSYNGSVAESFLHAKVGAIGSLGANTVTYSHYNDLITWGMFDYFWPDYLPTLSSQTEPDFAYPSYSLVAGKLFLSQQAFLPYTTDTIKVEKTLNLFSFLGETYLNLYTEVPQPLSIEAPLYLASNQSEYSFTAEEGAVICLSSNDEIIAVARATGQTQSFMLPQMEIGDQFILTATHQNRFRHTQTVSVISEEQPYVYLKSATLNDQDGNGQLDYGEYAEIDVTLRDASQIASQGGDIILICDSPYIEIMQGTVHYPQMGSDTTITIESAFRIKLANEVPDQTDILLTFQFVENENTHNNSIHATANAPLIVIEKEFHPMTADGEPSTHISAEGMSSIAFTLNNTGHSTAKHISSTLDLKAPFVSVERPECIEALQPNESASMTHIVSASANDISGAWLQSRLDIQYGERHTCLDTIIQYGGLFESFESDTLNQAFNWSPGPNTKWSFYEDAYDGQRCIRFAFEDHNAYSYTSTPKGSSLVNHDSKTSFRYKTHLNDCFIVNNSGHSFNLTASDSWTYAEVLAPARHLRVIWSLASPEPVGDTLVAFLDDICFPPRHTTIAYAGDDLMVCDESPIELVDAYAYDCDSILWTTDGDGHFDCDTIANPIYFPGSQDLAHGNVTLTLTAFGNDTIVSSIQIQFMDEISLDSISGDNIVNKYQNQVSHYSIENQNGIRYLWQLEPATAGSIYNHGNEIDILWNLNEGDADVTLSVMAVNGCSSEPVTKTISLIGYSTAEWSSVNFDLYPNPTNGKVNLVIGKTLQGKAVIEVYNLLGERVLVQKASQLRQGETITLDLSKMVSGLYIIKLSTENGCCSKKVSVW